jgi:fatty-acid desaturase
VAFVGLLVAVYGFCRWGFSWIDLAIVGVMYTATALGIKIGFSASARHGLRWWQLDLGHLVICVMTWLGLARACAHVRKNRPKAQPVRREARTAVSERMI